jgi:hypothetical protein
MSAFPRFRSIFAVRQHFAMCRKSRAVSGRHMGYLTRLIRVVPSMTDVAAPGGVSHDFG